MDAQHAHSCPPYRTSLQYEILNYHQGSEAAHAVGFWQHFQQLVLMHWQAQIPTVLRRMHWLERQQGQHKAGGSTAAGKLCGQMSKRRVGLALGLQGAGFIVAHIWLDEKP